MSYVDSQLLSGETVVYRAHLHKSLFIMPAVLAVLSVVAIALAMSTVTPGIWIAAGLLSVIAAFSVVGAWITYSTSEFAVTNKRVVMKVGWLRRRSLETMLSKVEGIAVDQGLLGRMLDFGTIGVTGTGGTQEAFRRIGAPLEFRRQVQDVVSRIEESRSAAVGAPAGGYAPPRNERECPFCAERILVKAKVCKHCGRDVSAVGV